MRSFDGVDIAVHSFPASNHGPDFWLSHATGFCAACWQPVAAGLRAEATQIVAWDFRGHGASGSPAPELSWWDMAADLHAVVGSMPDSARLSIGVGHSMGGAVLAMAELNRPGTFDAIVAVEPILLGPPYRRMSSPIGDVVRKRRRVFASREAARTNFEGKTPFSRWHPGAFDGYLADGLRDTPDGVELSCSPEFEAEVYDTACGHGVFGLLERINIPFIVIVGEASDTYDAAWGGEIAAAMPKGELRLVPDGSHFIPMEQPRVVVDEVLAVAAMVEGQKSE